MQTNLFKQRDIYILKYKKQLQYCLMIAPQYCILPVVFLWKLYSLDTVMSNYQPGTTNHLLPRKAQLNKRKHKFTLNTIT